MARKKWWIHDRTLYRPDCPDLEGDPQAVRVYRMERDIKGMHKASTTDEADLNWYATEACKMFNVKIVPEIYVVNKRTDDIGWCNAGGIWLNEYRSGNAFSIFLHEIAHWICDDLYPDAEGHGPEWAWIYIELVDRFRVMPRWLFTQLFDKYGIKYVG